MEIHKPKAAHSWREFMIEIGTIICGILIALGLEQVVESAHHRTEVREAREALDSEIRENAARLRFSIEEDACVLEQLKAFEAWARGGPKPPTFRYFVPILKASTWETVKGGAVPHMALKQRLALTSFYDQLDNQHGNRQVLTDLHLRVAGYEGLADLTAERREALLALLSRERRVIHNNDGNASYLMDLAADLAPTEPGHEPAVQRVRAGVEWVCGRAAQDPFVTRR